MHNVLLYECMNYCWYTMYVMSFFRSYKVPVLDYVMYNICRLYPVLELYDRYSYNEEMGYNLFLNGCKESINTD